MRSAWGLSFSFLDSARSEAVRAALFLDFSSQKGSIGDDCAVTTATRIYIYLIAVGAMTHGRNIIAKAFVREISLICLLA